MAFKSSKGRDVGKEVKTFQSSEIGRGFGGGGGGGLGPLDSPIYKFQITGGPGPETNQVIDLADYVTYSYTFTGDQQYTIVAQNTFDVNVELIGGGGGGGGGGAGSDSSEPDGYGNGGNGGLGTNTTINGPNIGPASATGGGGGGGAAGQAPGGPGSGPNTVGGSSVGSSSLTWTAVSGNSSSAALTNSRTFDTRIIRSTQVSNPTFGTAQAGNPGPSSGASGGGGGQGKGGGYIRSNFTMQAGVSYTIDVGQGAPGTPRNSSGASGQGNDGAAAIGIRFYDI